jgi:hypothetical protein
MVAQSNKPANKLVSCWVVGNYRKLMSENILPSGTYKIVKFYTENFGRRFTIITMEGSYDAVNVPEC